MAGMDTTGKKRLPPQPFSAPNVYALAVVAGEDVNAIHRITATSTIVGRGEGVTFRIEDDQMSKEHLELQTLGSVVTVVDLDSSNGTMLNRHRLKPGVRERLKHLDELTLGNTKLLFLAGRYRQG